MRKLPKSVNPSKVDLDFEAGWVRMVKDLRTEKTFYTTGSDDNRKIIQYRVWSEGNRIKYKNSRGKTCPLRTNDFKKGHSIFMQQGSLIYTPYKSTRHGSYIPPLLFRYFMKS